MDIFIYPLIFLFVLKMLNWQLNYYYLRKFIVDQVFDLHQVIMCVNHQLWYNYDWLNIINSIISLMIVMIYLELFVFLIVSALGNDQINILYLLWYNQQYSRPRISTNLNLIVYSDLQIQA